MDNENRQALPEATENVDTAEQAAVAGSSTGTQGNRQNDEAGPAVGSTMGESGGWPPADGPAPTNQYERAEQQVPLYAAAPPEGWYGERSGQAGPTNDEYAYRQQSYARAPYGASPAPPLVSPKGPSALTIILGCLLMAISLIGIAVGTLFPFPIFTGVFFISPRVFVAMSFGIVGGLLLVIAALWAIFSYARTRKSKADANQGHRGRPPETGDRSAESRPSTTRQETDADPEVDGSCVPS